MYSQLTAASGDGFPVQFGKGRGCGGGNEEGELVSSLLSKTSGDGQDVFLFVKYCYSRKSLLEKYWVHNSTMGSLSVYKLLLEKTHLESHLFSINRQ